MTNRKNDLTMHSDAELSLTVMNDEYLYNKRRLPLRFLRAELEEFFLFSEDQWDELVEDLEADRAEDEDDDSN